MHICSTPASFLRCLTFLLCITAHMLTEGCGVDTGPRNRVVRRSTPLLASIQDDVALIGESPTGYYEQEYRPYEPLFWSKIAGWMVEDAIERNYPQARPMGKILDLGCGFGTLLCYATTIYGGEGICVDVIPYVEEKENILEIYDLSFARGDIEREPLPVDGLFDVIILTEVLEHLNFRPVPTLRKIHEKLAEGGSFFLSTPDSDSGWGRNYSHYNSFEEIPPLDPAAEWIDDHIWHYDREELLRVLTEAGFTIKRIDHSESSGGSHFNVWATK